MPRANRGTLLGLASIAIWSTSVPVSRRVTEALGVLPGAAAVLTTAGLLLIAFTVVRRGGIGWIRRMSLPHVRTCGPLFVGYMLCLYAAVGTAGTRTEALAAGLANYLWPTMILILSVAVLRRRAAAGSLAGGIAVSLAGIVLAVSTNAEGWGNLATALLPPSPAILFGLAASVLWGLYSVLAHRSPQPEPGGAVGLFLLVTGVALLPASVGHWPAAAWTGTTAAAVLYMALLPNSLAYWFWDTAMQSGNVTTLGAASNAIPVLSILIGSGILGIGIRVELLAGAALVAIGAVLSRRSFRRSDTAAVR